MSFNFPHNIISQNYLRCHVFGIDKHIKLVYCPHLLKIIKHLQLVFTINEQFNFNIKI